MLKILVRGTAMAGAAICNNLGDKPSRPTSLPSSSESYFFKTYSKSKRVMLQDTPSQTLELIKCLRLLREVLWWFPILSSIQLVHVHKMPYD